MHEILLGFIIIFHYFVVCFIVITPFLNSNYLLLMHVIIVPFIMLHWILNDNTCALTVIERMIRYKVYGTMPESNETFIGQIVNPIYDFKKNNVDNSKFIYIITFILWSISVSRLLYKYKTNEISNFYDLLML